jgi:hypothetical protein
MTKAPWKSKDLITRLRWRAFKFTGKGDQENLAVDVMCDAADRIEKLEAALREIAAGYETPWSTSTVGNMLDVAEILSKRISIARKALGDAT